MGILCGSMIEMTGEKATYLEKLIAAGRGRLLEHGRWGHTQHLHQATHLHGKDVLPVSMYVIGGERARMRCGEVHPD